MELGLDHIKYHSYYPDCTSYPNLEIAITAGESQLAPYLPKKINRYWYKNSRYTNYS